MRNPDLVAIVNDFMGMLESTDDSKFKRFSKVTDEISIKLLSRLREYEVLVVVNDRYSFKFSIKVAEKKSRQKTHLAYTGN